MYSISTGKDTEAKRMMSKVFKRAAGADQDKTLSEGIDLQYEFIKMFTNMESSSVSFCEAVCGSNYRRATWTCFFLNIFNQASSINGVLIYVARLVEKIGE
jgi:hypothetical protein